MTHYDKSQAEELLKVTEAPKPTNELRWCTFFDNGMSIKQMRDAHSDIIYPNMWCEDEAFYTLTEEPQERTLLMDMLPDSNNKAFEEQVAMQPRGCEVPKARQLMMMCVLHFKATGERLLVNDWIRCCDKTARGRWVCARWSGDRLDFGYWSGDAGSYIGSLSARTS